MRALAERFGNRIHLRTTPYYAALDEELPGAGWSKRERAWTFGLSMDSCRLLREHFGRSLVIGPQLDFWAREQVSIERSQAALGRNLGGVELSRVPRVAPELAKVLSSRPYQSSAALFVVQGRSVLIGDTPGLGKTTEAIAGIVESGVPGPYLICAPKTSLDVVWEREIAARLPRARVVVVSGDLARRTKKLKELLMIPTSQLADTWVVTNIEMLRTKTFWVCPTCKICTERMPVELADNDEPTEDEEPVMQVCGKRYEDDLLYCPKCGGSNWEPNEWPASDKPKASVVKCGHDPKRVRIRHDHKYPILFAGDWGAVVMDECQRSLIRNSGTPTQARNGARLLSLREDGLRIAASGTPMRGKPQRLFGILNWLFPKTYRGFWSWLEMYWHVTQNRFGARQIGRFNTDREAAFFASLDRVMIRRTKLEVSPELPPKAYMGTPLDPRDPDSPTAIWLPMEPAQESAYHQMLASGSAIVEGGQLNAVGMLAEMTRLKQFANGFGEFVNEQYRPALPSNKFDWLVQFLTERNLLDPKDADEEPAGKVVIVSQFSEVLRMLWRELVKLGLPADGWAAVTGKITGAKRQEAIDRFNDPTSPANIMFLNTLAGGVAVTLDVADDMVLFDELYVPDDQEQVEDRINNRRPEEKVVTRRYWYLKSVGTIDEAIARTNLEMDRNQKWTLDGRRGVPYLREVFRTMKELADRA